MQSTAVFVQFRSATIPSFAPSNPFRSQSSTLPRPHHRRRGLLRHVVGHAWRRPVTDGR